MAKTEKKRSILARIRNYFIAGVVVLIPIGITVYLTIFLVSISSKIIPKEINPNHYLPYDIPGVEILMAIFLITLIGWLSLSFLGKKLLNLFNNILKKIPILRTIYSAIVQMTQTFTKRDNGKNNVVLVEYPRKGTWAVGFATKENFGEIRNKSKKVWHRKIHVYNAALGVFELDYDYARQTLWKINKSKEKTWK